MGGQSCKCECDGDKKSETGQNAIQQSSFQEEVESKAPKLPAAAATPNVKKAEPPSQAEPARQEPQPPPPAPAPAPAPALAPASAARPAPAPTPEKASPPDKRAATPGGKKLVFELEVNKPLGARFAEMTEPADTGGALVATNISEKSVLMWTKDGSYGICAGDVISQVNGESGGKDRLLKLLQDAKLQGGTLEVVVKPRPPTFEVTLQKTGDEKMGIVVAVHDDINDKVEVRQVSDEGAVPLFNEKNHTTQVVSGDWVTAVNGVSKGANEMIQDMQDCWKKGAKLAITLQSHPSEAIRNTKKKSDGN